MTDFLKFKSDKSYVHEITYLTDASYELKRHPNISEKPLIKTVLKNHWYTNQGADVTDKVRAIIKRDKNHVQKMIKNIKDILSN